ncbi:MAG: hypothetical protein RXR82_09075 [Nitrososphaeria archaeon]
MADTGDVILGVVALAAAGAVGYYVYKRWKQQQSSSGAASASAPTATTSGPTVQQTSTPPQEFTVTFKETGLPYGMTWYVNVAGQDLYATAPNPISASITGATAPVSWSAPVLYGGMNVLGLYTWKWVPNPSHGTVAQTETINITYTGTYNI